jgi:hypothetical protein
VAFFLVSAFHEVIVGVKHINTFVDEIETVHKIVCTILDRDKDLMKKPGVNESVETKKHFLTKKRKDSWKKKCHKHLHSLCSY